MTAMSGVESGATDWATMAEEEEWQEKHDEVKLRKDDIKLDSVLVASCSDDGTLRIWLPTLVCDATFL